MKIQNRYSEPNNRETSLLFQLLLWLTHLKPAVGPPVMPPGKQGIGLLESDSLLAKLIRENGIVKDENSNKMKMKNQIIKGLALIVVLLASSMGVISQTNDAITQSVCPGSEPYKVIPGNEGNTFLWSISPGTSGTEWTILSPTTAITDIVWANPADQKTFTVIFRETAPTGCYDDQSVDVTVNPAPTAPLSDGDIVQCEQSPIQILTASANAPSGSTVVWYDAATDGTIIPSPTLSAVGTVTYYAESVVTITGCTSLTRTAVILTINATPEAPTATDQIVCSDGTAEQTLTATAVAPADATVVWYDAATAGTVVAVPTQVGVGTITYYAESVATTGTCPSLTRKAVILTINATPEAPTASDETVCSDGTLTQTLTATATAPVGSTVVWYDAATAGNVVTTLTQVGVGTITYYAESVAATGTCPSLTRTPVVLTINATPEAPTASDETVCSDGTLTQTLTAIATVPVGSTVVWYDAATAGTIVTTPTQVGVGTVTYYAESVAATGICPSLTRKPVILTINPTPIPTITTSPDPVCATVTTSVYTTEEGMTNYVWTLSAGGEITSGGTVTDNTVTVTWNIAGPQTVSVNYKNSNGCAATTATVTNVTVSPLPATSPIYHR